MQQCIPRANKSTLRPTLQFWPRACLPQKSIRRSFHARSSSASILRDGQTHDSPVVARSASLQPFLGGAIAHPSRREGQDISAWVDRLDPILPLKLRSGISDDTTRPPSLPSAVFSFISDARRLKSHDVLLEYARRGRWKALVWLVTYLVDGLWKGNPTAAWKLPESLFGSIASLDELVERPIKADFLTSASSPSHSLDGSVITNHPLSRGKARNAIQGHQTLGEIWQSLGIMIIEDAAKNQGPVRPEILELIAILHSRGIMPDSIYTYSSKTSRLAGTQPPTLRILSSQIMASLSDAAWNARQASAMEEARLRGNAFGFQGPELPSSDYRVHVAGIRHEIWLELVLWSCLHGGWVQQGAAVVEAMIKQKVQPWSPLSWRETMSPLIRVGDESSVDWENLEYLFAHGRAEAAHENGSFYPKIEKTISSEVISSYVDGIVNLLSSGVGERGLALGNVMHLLIGIKKFLGQNNYGLESTSWDAVVQRILESESISVEDAPNYAESLLSLSASYGDEEASLNVPRRDEAWRPMSPYLSDGSALTLGVAHRALSAYIDRGEFAGAFRTFRELQFRTDNNKRLSIAAFFRNLSQRSSEDASTFVNFSSPLASISYPSMFTMLPATVLAPFLDLITEIKAFKFGSWLVASQDVDGPTVGPLAYRNPIMIPSLIRFLAASKNEELLGKMLRTIREDPRHRGLPADVLLAILESQFELNNPVAAMATFDTIVRTCTLSTSTTETLMAMLCREVVKSPNPHSTVRNELVQSLRGEQSIERKVRRNLAAILMHVDDDLRNLCREAIKLPENLTIYPDTRSFNLILEGCVARYGSTAGRALLCRFSQTAQRVLIENTEDSTEGKEETGIAYTRGNVRPSSVYTPDPDRIDMIIEEARVPAMSEQKWDSVRVGGRFSPNASSVRIILNKRLQEIRSAERQEQSLAGFESQEQRTAASVIEMDETVQWAKRMLGALGMRQEDIVQEAIGNYEETEGSESQAI